MPKTKLLSLCLVLSLLCWPVQALAEALDPEPRSQHTESTAVSEWFWLYGLVLPGAGQMALNEPLRGSLFLGGAVATGLAGWGASSLLLNQPAVGLGQQIKHSAQAGTVLLSSLILVGLIWLGAVADAWYLNQLKINEHLSLSLEVQARGYALSLRF